MRKYANEITPDLNGQEIEFFGWVHETRLLGGIKFLVLKDRSGFIQVTALKKTTSPELFKSVDALTKESFVSVKAKVQASKEAPNGVELLPLSLEVISKAAVPLPLDTSGKIESDLSVRLDHRFLDIRSPKGAAIFKVRSKIIKLATEFFDSNGFIAINTPKLVIAGVETGAEQFKLSYFGREAFLSQSPQIYKQMALASGLDKVYEIGVVFRAEKSHTTRHLTEFTGLDFEIALIKSEHDVMDVLEKFFKFLFEKLNEECKAELKEYNIQLVPPKKIPRISMKEAKELLAKKGKKLAEEDDLDAESERLLWEYAKEKFGEEFIFVYNYPWNKRPFYHMKLEDDPKGTKSFDLIFSGFEISTGSQREHRQDILIKQAKEKGVSLDSLKAYLEMFSYGTPQHGGAGLGVDRITQGILKLENVKEAVFLPRDPERLSP